MTETGTLSSGAYSESVVGTDTISQQEIGNSIQGTYTRDISGGGAYSLTETGGTMTPGTGSNSYSLAETANVGTGDFSLAETGTDRYGLLQQFDNIAQTSGTSTPGHMNYNPFGDAFVDDAAPPEKNVIPVDALEKIADLSRQLSHLILQEAIIADKLNISMEDVRWLKIAYNFNPNNSRKPVGPSDVLLPYIRAMLSDKAKKVLGTEFLLASREAEVEAKKQPDPKQTADGQFKKLLDNAANGSVGLEFKQSTDCLQIPRHDEIDTLEKTELGKRILEESFDAGIMKSIKELTGETLFNIIANTTPIGTMQGSSKAKGLDVHVLTYYNSDYNILINVAVQVGGNTEVKRIHTSLLSGVEVESQIGVTLTLQRKK